jgi:hypothetical protein
VVAGEQFTQRLVCVDRAWVSFLFRRRRHYPGTEWTESGSEHNDLAARYS